MNRTCILLIAALALTLTPTATAQLFGSDGSAGNLYTVNETTGATTLIGNMGVGPVTEIEFTPAGLFGTNGGGGSSLVSINPATGTAAPVAMHTFGAINGLAYDTASGTLYGTYIPGPGMASSLVTVNTTTAAITMIGPTGVLGSMGGLTFVGGTLLAVNSGGFSPTLYSINTATGMATPLAPVATPGGVPLASLRFTAAGNLIAGGYDGVLYAINSGTGAATPIGPHGSAFKLSGIADAGGALPTPNCPGTGEDLVSVYSLNAGPNVNVGGGSDVLALSAGDLLQITHFSPGGTFIGVGNFIVLGSSLPTGSPFPVVFPGLCLNLPTVFGILVSVGGAPITLGPAGFSYAFIYSGASPGTSLLIQGIVTTATAANGIFASTNGLELQL